MYENCGYVQGIGDSYCDDDNNTPECGYDGGDCCECTCVPDTDSTTDTRWQGCKEFACIDPDATCVNDDDITVDMYENCGYVSGIGNGYCDRENNIEECDYDGGDCCECTCVGDGLGYDDFHCSQYSGFACIDPSAPCVDDDSVTVDMIDECYAGQIGDGWCDDYNNKEECAFDGGDCCDCTCTGGMDDDYSCRFFACIDPEAACVNDDDITVEMYENCGYVQGIGNSYCDDDNNTPECGYDGGDCCECTCVPDTDSTSETRWQGCKEFACIDPDATCVNDDDITVDMYENCGFVSGIGNGYCDQDNNIEECGYDGGDCCECTCVPYVYSDDYSDYTYSSCSNNFACIDPEAPCVDDDDITIDVPDSCDSVSMGNAYCDEYNNNAECGYDGGDCCECTCEDRPPHTMCGQWGGFACIDPDAACVNDDDITIGMVDICSTSQIGNGWCDQENNTPECNYDGGDCCECTCEVDETLGDDDYRCGQYNGFACIDPSAPCVDDDSVTVDMIDECDAGQIGNGWCDDFNNKEECAFDGGDCCDCTCTQNMDDDYSCRYFACIDPEAACVNDDDITVEMYENCGYVQGIGNSYCDDDNNTPECGYDGGDCCECTCVPDTDSTSDTRWQGCKEFACIDPDATCVSDDDITVDMHRQRILRPRQQHRRVRL
ncbi:unnamed protein product [Scytosiphon promiscuus]